MSEAFARMLFTESEGWAVLSACKANEHSYDLDEQKHGVFTYYLLEGLKGPADANNDGFITVPEASEYASLHVRQWAHQKGLQQSPTLQYNVHGGIVLLKTPPKKGIKLTIDRLRKRLATHKKLAFALLVLLSVVVGVICWVFGPWPPPPLPEDLDLLQKLALGEAKIETFAPYGKIEYQMEDTRLTIHYFDLVTGYNGCYINFSINTANFESLLINAQWQSDRADNMPKNFDIELKKQSAEGLTVVKTYKLSPSDQDIIKPISYKGTIDQITIVFFAEKVGLPEGTLLINKLIFLTRKANEQTKGGAQ
jgi:hypothetical protein